MNAFFTRFSKAIGALGGSGVGAILAWAFHATGHTLTPETVGILPVIGAVIATTLAPPNSITSPSPTTTSPTPGAFRLNNGE